MKLLFSIDYDPRWAELLRMNGWQMAVLGGCEELGLWGEGNAVALQTGDFRKWTVEVEAAGVQLPLEYKFVLYEAQEKRVVAWEEGGNRRVEEFLPDGDTMLLRADEARFDVESFRGAGVAVPVFSLRSEAGFGIGEFADLKQLADWAAATGLRMIQTLPVNETTLQRTQADSYPYNTLSVFALNPLYLRLQDLGRIADRETRECFEQRREHLNSLPIVDFEQVCALKWQFFRLIYQQERKKTEKAADFKDFFLENKDWLVPYAVFSFLRDRYKTADFAQWAELSVYDRARVADFYTQKAEEVNLYVFLQYHAHRQLSAAHDYAAARGVLLKGDIPIGVSPTSVDVWQQPALFNTGVQAGAPPDDFSERGQNWGFPTYNWDAMAQDGFEWWRARLRAMARYFDAYRIDHVLGFFRIWAVPKHAVWGLLGQFDKALPLSVEEITEFGLLFDREKMLKPLISEKSLQRHFPKKLQEELKEKFLLKNAFGCYDLQENVNTQRKIADSVFNQDVRDALLRLAAQVLFVQDAKDGERFHPRISFRDNDAFYALTEVERFSYERLYEVFFYHRHNEFWQEQAMQKLPALIEATSMLSCGEDLGMIPAGVGEVMRALHILSLEIQRMPKQWGREFGSPFVAPYLSVCTTSTHDMSPLRLWWVENREAAQRFFNTALFEGGEAPAECEAWVAERVVVQHLQSPAAWVVLPLQDWLATDADVRNADPYVERINVPDNPNNVWDYRMHISLEKLLQADDFTRKVAFLVEAQR